MLPPIIIVASGRSGTKMLRGILDSHPHVKCFPREINYIWRHGNCGYPTDELLPEHARPEVVQYIRKRFEALGRGGRDVRVLEKTCSNSLRIGFVHTVFPEAFFVHLIRDGRAVAESARRNWLGHHSLGYLLEKARWVPPVDVPYYALRYFRYQTARFRSPVHAHGSWGPRFVGLDKLVAERSMIEVCGLQWKTCVQRATAALKYVPPDQTVTVRYEDLVRDPVAQSRKIFEAVGLTFAPECERHVVRELHQSNLRKWHDVLTEEDLRLLMPHIGDVLQGLGYDA